MFEFDPINLINQYSIVGVPFLIIIATYMIINFRVSNK
jgi:hypothetical protein